MDPTGPAAGRILLLCKAMVSILLWFGGVMVFTLLAPPIMAFSQGASPASCKEMIPGHIRAHPLDPEQSYITVQMSASSYLPGQLITVMIRSSRDFMGFLLQARNLGGVKRRQYGRGAGIRSRSLGALMAGGSWILTPPGTHTLHCLTEGDTITHSDKQLKRNLSFVWRAPDVPMGDIRFIITVVQSYFIYWAGIESAVVHDGSRTVWSSDENTAVDGGSTVSTVREERVTTPPRVNNPSEEERNWTQTFKPTRGESQTLNSLKTQAEVNQTTLGLGNSVTLTNHTSKTNTMTLGDTHMIPDSDVSKEITHDPEFPPKTSIPLTSSILSDDLRKMDTTTRSFSLSKPPFPFFPQKGKWTQRDDPQTESQKPKVKTKSEKQTPGTSTSAPSISQAIQLSNTPPENQTESIQEEISSTFETRRMLENTLSLSQTSKVKTETGLLLQTSTTKLNLSFQTDTSWITSTSKTPTTSAKTRTTSLKTQTTSPKTQTTFTKNQTTSTKTRTTSPNTQTTSPQTETTSPNTQTTSTKTRTTSPKTQTTFTKNQTTSTKTRTTSPNTQTTSPQTETTSPNTQTTSTKTRTTSPKTQTTSLKTQTTSPKTQTTSTKTRTTSPQTETTSPKTRTTSPQTETTSPNTQTTSPHTQTTSPNTQTTSPNTQTTSPQTETTSANTQTTSPKTQTTSTKIQTTSPKIQTTSPKTQTTSPKIQTTSPKTQTTSLNTRTTSPKTQKIPITSPKTQTTSPKTQTTSPKTQTTSPKTQTTSPKTQTTSLNTRTTSPKTQKIPITSPKTQTTSSKTQTTSPKTQTTSLNTRTTSTKTQKIPITSLKTPTTSPKTQTTSPKTQTTSPKTQTTSPKSAFPSKFSTFGPLQVPPINQVITSPGSSPSGPKNIEPTVLPENSMSLSVFSQSLSLSSFYQTSSETQSQTSAVKAQTVFLSQTSSSGPNLPFQTQTSHISLLLEMFTPKTQTISKSVLPSKSPTLKSFRVMPITQTNPLPETSPSGPKSTPKQTISPQTIMSLKSPSQHQSGVSFHQVQTETVPTQPGLLQRGQSQSEVPEETLRTSPQPQSQTVFQTGQTLSPQPVKPQYFTLEKDLETVTVSPVFVFTPSSNFLSPISSSSSFQSLDGSSGLRPSDASPLHSTFRSTIPDPSSSENEPRAIPVSTSHLPSAQRSSTTNQPSFLKSPTIPPNTSNYPSNSSFSSATVSTSSIFNSSKCFTSSNFSSSSAFAAASQKFFSLSSSPPTPTSFASSPTLPPPSVSFSPTPSSFISLATPHPGPSSSHFLQTSFTTPSKKTNPQPNLGSVVHPNPKPFPNHKLDHGQESKPNIPNTDTKPKRPSSPSNTPDREGKYPDINPRHSSWELGMLLGSSAGLGMVLVVGVRYIYRQACGRRTQVTLNDQEREYGRGLIQVQECGDLVRVRKIRENSFVLLTEYDVLAPPGN